MTVHCLVTPLPFEFKVTLSFELCHMCRSKHQDRQIEWFCCRCRLGLEEQEYHRSYRDYSIALLNECFTDSPSWACKPKPWASQPWEVGLLWFLKAPVQFYRPFMMMNKRSILTLFVGCRRLILCRCASPGAPEEAQGFFC